MSNSELVNALIREHLHALKLEKTLEQFKQEVPNSNAITSRRDLAHQLGIRKLVKDNRTSGSFKLTKIILKNRISRSLLPPSQKK